MYSKKVIIIGCSRGKRSLDTQQSTPLSLVEIGGSRALEWNLTAFKNHRIVTDNINFIAGYHIEKVVSLYPELNIFFNPDWAEKGPLNSLKFAPDWRGSEFYLCTDRVVLREKALEKIDKTAADIVVALSQSEDYEEGELLPLLYFSAKGSEWLYSSCEKLANSTDIAAAIQQSATKDGLKVAVCPLENDISALKDSLSLSKFIFGSKSQTLERLRPMTTHSTILKQIKATVGQWLENPQYIIAQAQILMENLRAEAFSFSEEMDKPSVVVRSSCKLEDTWQSTQAGRFESVLNIAVDNADKLTDAIHTVVESYRENPQAEHNPEDEFFIQPHLTEVKLCGVCFTQEQQSGAPYYIISFDRSGKTDVVTSGGEGETCTRIIWKESDFAEDEETALIIRAVKEIEFLFGYDRLDIEFAVSPLQEVYILQVRPLAGKNGSEDSLDSDFRIELGNIRNFYAQINSPSLEMLGRTTVLGNMPDWNPAEMIGKQPRPLAASLYRVLITDSIWAQARAVMGYRDLTGTPLMLLLSSQPYIDMRASFNSFIPAGLADGAATELVECYLEYVREKPELHDKIEFEVAVTCADFLLAEHRKRLLKKGVSPQTVDLLFDALRKQTAAFINFELADINYYNGLLAELGEKCSNIAAGLAEYKDIPAVIHQVVSLCRKYGTFPFSVQARHGFVAMTLLRTLSARGVLTEEEYSNALQSIPTIASDISVAILRLGKDSAFKAEFVEKFGHLRPSSYNILSPNYGDMVELGAFDNSQPLEMENKTQSRGIEEIFTAKKELIANLLAEIGLKVSVPQLVKYIQAAIPARESGKFEFMKAINLILTLVSRFGAENGFSDDNMSYVEISRILELRSNSASLAYWSRMKSKIAFEEKRHTLGGMIKLPYLISSEKDLFSFMLLGGKPNYITSKVVREHLYVLEGNAVPEDIDNRIVYIESADPGYDWIFSRKIKGLITMYGGVASHMAIRAAEFSLPSAIGCGSVIAESLLQAEVVELNCLQEQINIIR